MAVAPPFESDAIRHNSGPDFDTFGEPPNLKGSRALRFAAAIDSGVQISLYSAGSNHVDAGAHGKRTGAGLVLDGSHGCAVFFYFHWLRDAFVEIGFEVTGEIQASV